MSASKLISREQCPKCREAGRDTHEDNLGVFDDGHKYCFACQYLESKGTPDQHYTFEYLPWRGIDKNVMRFYDIRTKIDVTGRPIEVALRYPNGSIQIRKIDTKDFYWNLQAPKPEAGLFGMDKFAAGCADSLIITEGGLDAASYRQVCPHVPVVSVQSSFSAQRDVLHCRSFVSSFPRIYLAFDGDGPGNLATDACAKLFEYDKVYRIRFTRPDRKDANDYLRNGEQSELLSLFNNAQRYVPDTVICTFEDYKKVFEEEVKPGVPYPPAFRKLNEMTYGMRTGESVLLTAMEGVGKTEIVHAIEYQLLKETDDAIAAFFLEEPKLRHVQALAGIHLGKPIHLPDQAVPAAEAFNAFKEVVRLDQRLHLYSNFGSVAPNILMDLIRYLVSGVGCRWVLFDHISMVCSGLSNIKDERREIDQFTTQLESSVVELGYGLFMVSHVNDEGRTRSSRWPAKVANTRINLSRDHLHPDQSVANVVNLILDKNRFASKTGYAGSARFNLNKYAFEEVAASDNFAGSTTQGFGRAT